MYSARLTTEKRYSVCSLHLSRLSLQGTEKLPLLGRSAMEQVVWFPGASGEQPPRESPIAEYLFTDVSLPRQLLIG